MLTLTSIEGTITDLFQYFIDIAAVVVVGAFVWAAILMMTAGGDQARYQKGKDMLVQVVIGAAVIFGVGLIVNTIAHFATNPSDVLR